MLQVVLQQPGEFQAVDAPRRALCLVKRWCACGESASAAPICTPSPGGSRSSTTRASSGMSWAWKFWKSALAAKATRASRRAISARSSPTCAVEIAARVARAR